MQNYKDLEKIFARIGRIEEISGILHWDSAVMMPKMAAGGRAEQLAFLQGLHHETLTAPIMAEKIAAAQQETGALSDWQKANLRLMEHSWLHATAVDESLVTALSRAGSECENAWRTARAENDFKTFSRHMKVVLKLVREAAAAKASKLGLSKYDALLDQYDAGRKSADIDIIFQDLKEFLPEFLGKVMEHQAKRKILPIAGDFSVQRQKRLGELVIRKIGFDFNRGRMDTSHHPFCGGSSDDIRITCRYSRDNFIESFEGILHETGHALYEAGLPEIWRGQPVGSALGMTMHESQSLFLEMQICKSHEFCEFAAPFVKITFPDADARMFSGENLYYNATKVRPSLIRVVADEVTYPAHIILRYGIEKDLVEGRMEIDDLPEAWNEGMKNLLGVKVPDYKDGCMQDIHWTDGSFGYFPTYTLGAMTAAQLFQAMKKALPGILKDIGKGNFKNMREWLQQNIHSKGSRYNSTELMEKVTGAPLSVAAFKKHLEARYLDLA